MRVSAPYAGPAIIQGEFAVEVITTFLVLVVVILAGPRVSTAGAPAAEDAKQFGLVSISPPFKAPDFVLKNLQGSEVRLDSYQGTPLLLYFWATW
jgi:cytochrome oxidase Cu insertion factor (SCO1/SenC/PrrC family)